MVCIAGGPSLTAEDVAYCRGRARVVAVNNAHRLAPWADVLYACDAAWWRWADGAPGFTGLKVGLELVAFADVHVLKHRRDAGLDLDPRHLATGRNGGYQAINLAVHLGASRVILLGYDMRPDGNRLHWHGRHPGPLNNPDESRFRVWRELFPTLVLDLQRVGVDVLNASRVSALSCFPRVRLEDVL